MGAFMLVQKKPIGRHCTGVLFGSYPSRWLRDFATVRTCLPAQAGAVASGLRYNSLPLRWRFLRNTDVDNQQETCLRELHLFAGAGGGILGGQLLGHRCVCAVEWEPYAQACLVARQNDGSFPAFPIWDDVQKFDGNPWCGLVDIVAGGFPCQDISVAGKGAGIDGERSGMWAHMARIIGEVRPQYAFIENSPALVNRGLDRVLCDLAALGYDAEWTVMGASDVGAPHKRERIWILAHAERHACNQRFELSGKRGWESEAEQVGVGGGCEDVAYCDGNHVQGLESKSQQSKHERQAGLHGGEAVFPAWPRDPADASEPRMGRVVDGMANRANRLKAIGNGQVPRVAAAAFAYLKSRIAE